MRGALKAGHITRRYSLLFALLAFALVALAGCQSAGGTGSQPGPSNGDLPGKSLPALTEPTATPSPVPPTPTTGSVPTHDPGTGTNPPTPTTPESQAAGDPGGWTLYERAGADGTRLGYRYPPTWTKDLTYCPGDKNTNQGLGSHLPTGCASTDFLFGQKAADVAAGLGPSPGKGTGAGGTRVVTQADTPLDTSKASSTYTVLAYDESGKPVSGFVTYIGPGTSGPDSRAILATLDKIAATVTVEK